jgi:hypothetical protein
MSKTKEIDDDIAELKNLLKTDDLKLKEKMQIYASLQKLYQLKLRYSGSKRGSAFTGGQS